jgi:hypothetical protein
MNNYRLWHKKVFASGYIQSPYLIALKVTQPKIIIMCKKYKLMELAGSE